MTPLTLACITVVTLTNMWCLYVRHLWLYWSVCSHHKQRFWRGCAHAIYSRLQGCFHDVVVQEADGIYVAGMQTNIFHANTCTLYTRQSILKFPPHWIILSGWFSSASKTSLLMCAVSRWTAGPADSQEYSSWNCRQKLVCRRASLSIPGSSPCNLHDMPRRETQQP